MKRLIHWGLIASLAGVMGLAPALLEQQPVLAIPESDVLKRLEKIPLFVVSTPQRALVSEPIPNPKDQSKILKLTRFFLGKEDAQAYLGQYKAALAKTNQPQLIELSNTWQVLPISYRYAIETVKQNKEKKDELIFQFLPTQQQVTAALAIVNQGKPETQKVKEFKGIPLFYVVDSKDSKLVTFEQEISQGQNTRRIQSIPFFFNKQDLDAMLSRLQQQSPPPSPTKIEVTSLGIVLNSMIQTNEPVVQQMQLVPSISEFRFAIQTQNNAAPQPAPGAAQPRR